MATVRLSKCSGTSAMRTGTMNPLRLHTQQESPSHGWVASNTNAFRRPVRYLHLSAVSFTSRRASLPTVPVRPGLASMDLATTTKTKRIYKVVLTGGTRSGGNCGKCTCSVVRTSMGWRLLRRLPYRFFSAMASGPRSLSSSHLICTSHIYY